MFIKAGFDDDFTTLMLHLEAKYGKEMFDLDGIGKQKDINEFSKTFFTMKTNTADVSIDANANVDGRDMISYNVELPKAMFRINAYYLLWKKMRQLYGKDDANKIIEMQLAGKIYINDFHGLQTYYCYNYSTLDIALEGLPMVKKIKSIAPKYLFSFKSQLEQFVTIASNSSLGATGIADVFIVMSYYIDMIFENGHDAGFFFDGWFNDKEKEQIEEMLMEIPHCQENTQDEINRITKEINGRINKTSPSNERLFKFNVWKYIKETLVSFIYTINQPSRGGIQSPFVNVSVFDDTFLNKLVPDYKIYRDGEVYVPKIKTIKQLQELFLDTMNQELRRTSITFPVTTACFAVGCDSGKREVLDKEFRRFVAKKNLEFGFINIYCGKTSTLSSCCFQGDEVIEVYNKNTETYDIMKMKDFVSLYTDTNNDKGLKIDNDYQIKSLNPDTLEMEMVDVTGILKKGNEYNKLIEIECNGQVNRVTPDHTFLVKDRETDEVLEVRADNLLKNKDKYLLPVV